MAVSSVLPVQLATEERGGPMSVPVFSSLWQVAQWVANIFAPRVRSPVRVRTPRLASMTSWRLDSAAVRTLAADSRTLAEECLVRRARRGRSRSVGETFPLTIALSNSIDDDSLWSRTSAMALRSAGECDDQFCSIMEPACTVPM